MQTQTTTRIQLVHAGLKSVIASALADDASPEDQCRELGRQVEDLLQSPVYGELPEELSSLGSLLMHACYSLDLDSLEPMAKALFAEADRAQVRSRLHGAPHVMEAVAPAMISSSWRPARLFWRAFQIADPVGVFDSPLRTCRSIAHLKDTIARLGGATPRDQAELAEKLKVCAVIGLVAVIQTRAVSDEPKTRAEFCRWLIQLIVIDPISYLEAYRLGEPKFDEMPPILTESEPSEERSGVETLLMRLVTQHGLYVASLRSGLANDWARLMPHH